jgi:hypothetical protein
VAKYWLEIKRSAIRRDLGNARLNYNDQSNERARLAVVAWLQ